MPAPFNAALVSRRIHDGPGLAALGKDATRVVRDVSQQMLRFGGQVFIHINERGPVGLVSKNLQVYGRYETMLSAPAGLIYTQDDDCLLESIETLLVASAHGRVVCNMPQEFRRYYDDGVALVGFGAIYDSTLPQRAFERYLRHFPMDELFFRECDRIFTGLSDVLMVDLPKTDLPSANADDRLWKDPRRFSFTTEARRRIAIVKEKEPS